VATRGDSRLGDTAVPYKPQAVLALQKCAKGLLSAPFRQPQMGRSAAGADIIDCTGGTSSCTKDVHTLCAPTTCTHALWKVSMLLDAHACSLCADDTLVVHSVRGDVCVAEAQAGACNRADHRQAHRRFTVRKGIVSMHSCEDAP
jgi:hypothetical protein